MDGRDRRCDVRHSGKIFFKFLGKPIFGGFSGIFQPDEPLAPNHGVDLALTRALDDLFELTDIADDERIVLAFGDPLA